MTRNPEHIWNSYDDREFLEKLGGYRKDRRKGVEGLTLAGLMMFGTGLAIRDEFDNIFMDYRDESEAVSGVRWNDRVTYDGTWENNLFNFFSKVTPKLTADLKKPFKLEGLQRIDDTPVHRAVREAFVNMIIHADYLLQGTLTVVKKSDGFIFANPGVLKLPKDEIFKWGISKPRNSRMQTMLRLVGYGDNAGSGFPTMLSTWRKEGWKEPELMEDTKLNQVTLNLSMVDRVERKSTPSTPSTSSSLSYKDSDLREKIINLMQKNCRVTKKELSKVLGVSMYALKKQISILRAEGIVYFEGNSKNGRWIIQR